MIQMPGVDGERMLALTAELCRIPSPTGFTMAAIDWVESRLHEAGVETRRTVKGSLVGRIPGAQRPEAEGRMLSAHVDTLGAVVKEIKPSGRLRLSAIGGYDWSTVEGEYCLVHLRGGGTITGTVLTTKASSHVHGKAQQDLKRDDSVMEVRLDADVRSAADARALGVEVGDPVSWDPRTTITENGYIKSRHLDDKACVAIVIGVAEALRKANATPAVPLWIYISNYEEVGHGTSAGLPEGVAEVIAVDMAAVGEGQTSDERAVTVCVKDGSGPYDYRLSTRLIDLGRAHGIDTRVDVYTYYASDVSQALRAGHDIRGGLVGPGVDASHSHERLHRTSLEETARLLLAYALTA